MANAPIDKAKLTFAALALIAIGAFFSLFIPQQPQLFTGTGGEITFDCASHTQVQLNAAGSTYLLNDTCSVVGETAIQIGGNGITLDCQGHYILCDNNIGHYGVFSDSKSGITVKNCNVQYCQYGVFFSTVAASLINNTWAEGYYYTPPCAENMDEYTCNAEQGCSGSYTEGACSGEGGGGDNICWGMDIRRCKRASETCGWHDEGAGTCGYCTLIKDPCTKITDPKECDATKPEEGGICKFDNDCNVCVLAGSGYICADETDPDVCVAKGCTWTAGEFQCSGNPECSSLMTCAAFRIDYGGNNTMQNTSAIGAIGLHTQFSPNLTSTVANYSVTKYGVYQYGANLSHFTSQRLAITTGLGIVSQNGYDIALDKSNITVVSGSYAAYFSGSQRVNVTNTNISGYGSGLDMEYCSGNLVENVSIYTGSSYGFITYSFTNSTIRNLLLTSFSGYPLYLQGSSNTLTNITATTTGSGGHPAAFQNTLYNNVTNLNATGTGYSQSALTITGGGFNNFTNLIANTPDGTYGYAAYMYSTNNNTFRNITFFANGNEGIDLYQGTGNLFSGGSIRGKSNLYGAIDLYGAATLYTKDNVFENLNINGGGADKLIVLENVIANNTFRNNTLTNASAKVYVMQIGATNKFCLNNFTDVVMTYPAYYLYVGSTSVPSMNCTYDGKIQGNIYPNAVNLTGGVVSSIPNYYIGTGGTQYPYNATTSGGMFSCGLTTCTDYAPLFYLAPTVGNLTVNYTFGRRAQFGVLPYNGTQCWAATNQTSLVGVYNMTMSSGTLPVYAMLNATILPCYNLTLSLNNTCASGIKINETNQYIGNVTNQGYIWAWMDYAGNDCTTTPARYNLTID